MSDMLWIFAAISGYAAISVIGWFYLRRLYAQKRGLRIAHLCLSAALLVIGLLVFRPERSNAGIWMLIPMMSIISFEDIIAKRISNKILLLILAVGLLFALTNGKALLPQLLAPVVYGAIFIIISLVSRGGLGMGDAKLIAALSVYYGLMETCNVIFIAAVAECVVSVFVLIRTRNLRAEISFAPAIQLGALAALLWFI